MQLIGAQRISSESCARTRCSSALADRGPAPAQLMVGCHLPSQGPLQFSAFSVSQFLACSEASRALCTLIPMFLCMSASMLQDVIHCIQLHLVLNPSVSLPCLQTKHVQHSECVHSNRPHRHPNLQTLWRSHQWESAMAVIVPPNELAAAAAASAQAAQTPASASETSSGSLGQSNLDDSEALPNGHHIGHSHDQNAQPPADCSGAVLILGLRRGQYDLERCLTCL